MSIALAALAKPLLEKGLNLLGNAVLVKGKKWLEEKTGVDLSKPELTSADYVALRNYEFQHEEELIKLRQEDDRLDLEVLKVNLADTADARDMQKEALKQDDLVAKRFVYFFASAWSVFAIIYIVAITFIEIPEENIRFADTILDFLLGTVIATILNFFLGSSKSSQLKNTTITTLSKKDN